MHFKKLGMYWLGVLLCCFTFTTAHAGLFGSPPPQSIAFIDISEPAYQNGVELMRQWRQQEKTLNPYIDPDQNTFTCAEEFCVYGGIENLYLTRIPKGITVQQIHKAIAGDTLTRNQVQEILNKFDTYLGGMLVYDHSSSKVTIYAIPAIVGEPIFFLSVSLDEKKITLKQLNKVITTLVIYLPQRRTP